MLNDLIQLVRERGKSKFDGCDRLTGKLLENLALSPDPATRRYYASQLTGLVALQDIRYWETWLALTQLFSRNHSSGSSFYYHFGPSE